MVVPPLSHRWFSPPLGQHLGPLTRGYSKVSHLVPPVVPESCPTELSQSAHNQGYVKLGDRTSHIGSGSKLGSESSHRSAEPIRRKRSGPRARVFRTVSQPTPISLPSSVEDMR